MTPNVSPTQSLLGRFWRWWRHELTAALGPRPRTPKPPAQQVRIVDGEAIVSDRNGRERKRVVLLPADDLEIAAPSNLALVLPADQVLLRSLTVPRRAEPDLERVVDFEFDAHIPLRRAEVYAVHRIVGRDARDLQVNIVALRKDRIDRDRRALSHVGLSPSWVMPENMPVNLLDDGMTQVSRLRGPTTFALVVLTLVALTLGAWFPAWRLQSHNAALAFRAETAMVQANAAMNLQNDTRATLAEIAILDAFAKPTGALENVNDMAAGLSDQTSLLALSMAGQTLTLTGQAPTAAGLIEQLSAIKSLGNPELTAPVDTLNDGRERVSLQMSIRDRP